MPQITIDDIDPGLARALADARRADETPDQTVLRLLRRTLGIGPSGQDLAARASGWSQQELEDFERNVESFEPIEPEA